MGSVGKSSRTARDSSSGSSDYPSLDSLVNQKYDSFTDNPISGTSYIDWDDAGTSMQIQYMKEHTNAYDIIKDIHKSSEDTWAFKRWTEGHFMEGQQYYGMFSDMRENDQQYTRAYDKYLDNAVLNRGLVTMRRASPELLGLEKHATGKDIEEQLKILSGDDSRVVWSVGNLSSAVASTGLTIGDNRKSIDYRFHFPAKSVGAGMWVGDKRINDWQDRQLEFMINRDTGYKVSGWKYDRVKKVYVVDMYYVGRREHDYS